MKNFKPELLAKAAAEFKISRSADFCVPKDYLLDCFSFISLTMKDLKSLSSKDVIGGGVDLESFPAITFLEILRYAMVSRLGEIQSGFLTDLERVKISEAEKNIEALVSRKLLDDEKLITEKKNQKAKEAATIKAEGLVVSRKKMADELSVFLEEIKVSLNKISDEKERDNLRAAFQKAAVSFGERISKI